MRKERVVFDVIYRQLESDIKSKREDMIAMMGKAEKAEKARDEAKADLEKMRSEQDKQKDIFNVEWNDVIDKSIKEQHETSITPAQDILKLART